MIIANSQPQQNKQNIVTDFSGVPVEALESLRLRLTQLTHSLNKLQTEMKGSQLPHWVSLQSQFNIILTQLSSLSSTLSNYSEILEKTVVYPLPQFPTTEQEGLLTTLLRKKQLPEAVEWIQNSKKRSTDILTVDDEELTKWALNTLVSGRDNHEFKGFVTKEEIDNANNKMEEDKEIKVESCRSPTVSVNQALKFIYQGTLP